MHLGLYRFDLNTCICIYRYIRDINIYRENLYRSISASSLFGLCTLVSIALTYICIYIYIYIYIHICNIYIYRETIYRSIDASSVVNPIYLYIYICIHTCNTYKYRETIYLGIYASPLLGRSKASVSASGRQDEEQMPRETGIRQGRTLPTGDPHRGEDPAEDPPPEGGPHRGPTHNTHRQMHLGLNRLNFGLGGEPLIYIYIYVYIEVIYTHIERTYI